MITYEGICKKIGFDPIVEGKRLEPSKFEDDSRESPFKNLSIEELEFLTGYLIKNKHKLKQYIIK